MCNALLPQGLSRKGEDIIGKRHSGCWAMLAAREYVDIGRGQANTALISDRRCIIGDCQLTIYH